MKSFFFECKPVKFYLCKSTKSDCKIENGYGETSSIHTRKSDMRIVSLARP